MDAGRHAVGREHGGRALGDLGLGLDEDRAPLAQLLDDVLVVHDLLAHVDGRAVQLERVLHRLHGAVDAGAVSARRREQQLLGRGGHQPKCRERPESAIRHPNLAELGVVRFGPQHGMGTEHGPAAP